MNDAVFIGLGGLVMLPLSITAAVATFSKATGAGKALGALPLLLFTCSMVAIPAAMGFVTYSLHVRGETTDVVSQAFVTSALVVHLVNFALCLWLVWRYLLKKQSGHALSADGPQGESLPATPTDASSERVALGPARTAMPTLIAGSSVLIWLSIFACFKAMGWGQLSWGTGGWALLPAAIVGVGLGVVGISRRSLAFHPRLTLAIGIIGVLMNLTLI
jgi:hypothetical protein